LKSRVAKFLLIKRADVWWESVNKT